MNFFFCKTKIEVENAISRRRNPRNYVPMMGVISASAIGFFERRLTLLKKSKILIASRTKLHC